MLMASRKRGEGCCFHVLLGQISPILQHGQLQCRRALVWEESWYFCLWTDRTPSALAHKPQPVLAIICPRGQIQREVLPSEKLLRVELPISELPAEG